MRFHLPDLALLHREGWSALVAGSRDKPWRIAPQPAALVVPMLLASALAAVAVMAAWPAQRGDGSMPQARHPDQVDSDRAARIEAADAVIRLRVIGSLADDAQVQVAHLEVLTLSGHVALRGSVSDAAMRQRAGQRALAALGVVAVSNQLTVSVP